VSGVGYGLGVDLGTTYTAAAVRRGDVVEVLRLGVRRPEVPSVVFVPADGPVLVGEPAARRGMDQPGRLAREFKRRLGDPVPLLVGGAPYSAHALMARQLEHVLGVATANQDGPPDAVVVTCPANWGPYKRDLLDQAARLADLPPVWLRTEPEAAAIEYAAGERMSDGDVVAVYDLGGGTFDAAVLRRTPTGFDLLGTPEGIEQLGGADFDEAVFEHVVAMLPPDHLSPGDPEVVAALARLRRDCVEAKEALSEDTEVMVPVALPGLHTRVRLTRREFEAMISPALTDTVKAMRRALRSAGVEPAGLRAVLLSGGSSRIPLVSSLVGTAFERPVVLDPHPEHSIALGAARLTAGPPPPTAPTASAPPTASMTPAPPTASTEATAPAAATSTASGRASAPTGVPVDPAIPGLRSAPASEDNAVADPSHIGTAPQAAPHIGTAPQVASAPNPADAAQGAGAPRSAGASYSAGRAHIADGAGAAGVARAGAGGADSAEAAVHSGPPAGTGAGRAVGSSPVGPGTGTAGRGRRRRVLLAVSAVVVILAAVPLTIRLIRAGGEAEAGAGAGAGPASSAAAPPCGFTDEFDGSALAAGWERTRPDADITVAGSAADMDAPQGADIFRDNLTAPMLLRPVTGDFVLETAVEAAPRTFYQAAGLLLWDGPNNYVRIERGIGDFGAVDFEYKNGGSHERVHGPRAAQHPVKTDATRVVLRMSRVGGTITAGWRPADKPDFAGLGSIKVSLPDTVKVGVAVLNRAQFGATPTAFRARFDRVALTC
jgi:actin-like ATPase involved in cell morphogenesis